MKKSRFTETQIVSILNEADSGAKVQDVCRKHGIAPATYYKWKSKYGGLGASELKRIKELEAENAELKRIYARSSLQLDALQKLLEKNSKAARPTRSRKVSGGRREVVGAQGLRRRACHRQFWNRIPDEERERVVKVALEQPELTPRELAWHITDNEGWFISESSVYRILRANDFFTSPAYIVMSAADELKNKTRRVHEMWQTDFTYFKVIGWGWFYLLSSDTYFPALRRQLFSRTPPPAN